VGEAWKLSWVLEDVHGPLYSLGLHLWTGIAGDSEWALRLPSALLGVALVAAISRLSARWLGEETAVPAAWLAAGSPFLVWYAQEARNYTLLMLCACLATSILLGLGRRMSAKGGVGYVVAAWAGLLSNLSFALLGAVHLRWWLATPGSRARRLVRAASVAAALLLLASPWVPGIRRIWDWQRLHPSRTVATTETPLRGTTTFHAAAIPFAAASFAVGTTLGPPVRELRAHPGLATLRPYLLPLGLAAFVFGMLTVLGARALHRRGRLGEAVLWIVVPTALVSYFALQNFKVFHPRYLSVAAPGYLALLAAGLADLSPRWRAGFATAIAVLWGLSLQHHFFDPRYGKEDMRSAGAFLTARAVPGERIVAANTEELIFYYYRGPVPITTYWLGWAKDPVTCAERLDRLTAGTKGAWVVLSRGEDLDPTGAFARHLDARDPPAERHDFEGVRVWHLPPAAPSGTVPTTRS
jgi:mannosyltransferase